MGSSDEMFERGMRDADQDELNSFYYQHYYHYRRGYDRARRRRRQAPSEATQGGGLGRLRALGGGLLIVIALGVLGYGLWGRDDTGPTVSTGRSAAETPVAQIAVPTRIPRIPTDTPVPPTPLPPVLRVDGTAVIVNLSGGPLRLRAGAGTKEQIISRLPEGTEVKLLEGPVEADGYIWWRVESGESNGWVAEHSLEGVVWLEPR